MEFVDIPSMHILPVIEESVKEQMENKMVPEIGYIKVDRLEWTAEGIRMWIKNDIPKS
jgi:hypothetical protein